MAARLRAQLAALTADLSANKVSLTSTQSSLSSTQSTITITSSGLSDLSNNLYRVAQFDASRNALLSNVKSILTTTKNYEDPTTFPNGKGPYQVDIIPLVIEDKFKMPKFFNTTSTNIPNFTTEEFDTFAAPEVVIAVPSKRTTVETTTYYGSSVDNENNNLGNYNMAFEDFCMRGPEGGTDMLALLGETLHPIFLNFYNACLDVNTTTEQRQNLFNLFVNHPEFILRKNTAKVPFKTYNQVKDVNDGFIMDVLTDQNDVALINKLVNNSNYTTTVTRSSYPLDACGNPTELLPIAQNINALGPIDGTTGNNTTPLNANNKMGVVIYVSGSTGNYDTRGMGASLIASWGYVVINIITSPIWGSWQNFDTRKTICKLLIDKTLPSFSFRNPNNQYFINPNRAYAFEGGSSSANPSRFNHTLYSTNTPKAKILYERYIYQAIMCTKKLGLYNKINWSNALCIGRSAGATMASVLHSLQTNGIASEFTLNDSNGNSTGVKPFLCQLKAIVSWAGVFYDYTNTPLPKYAFSNEFSRNNRFNLGINVLKVPLIHINGDGDIYDTDDIRDSYFNNGVQTVFQLTKRELSSSSNIILGDSMVVYLPTNGHSPGTTSLVLNEGRVGSSNPVGVFSASSSTSLSQYMTIPSINNIVESGVTSESSSIAYNSMKLLLMLQLVSHRFLGDDYPVPQETFSYFGWRIDLMPTHCDILTDHEFMRVGPLAQISYDASYNITLSTNGTSTGGALTYNTVALSVDSSKNLVTDANSISFSSKKIYEDKWSFPYPLGPYTVDAIPIQLVDRFKMNKFTNNTSYDVSGGIESDSTYPYMSKRTWNLQSFTDVVVFAPSTRTAYETTLLFKQDVSTNTQNPGSFNLPLEDIALTSNALGSNFGDTLGTKMTAFYNLCADAKPRIDASGLEAVIADRKVKLAAILSDADFNTIKTRVKMPYKTFDVSNNGTKFIYEGLLDLSNNQLYSDLSGETFATLVTRSTYEDTIVNGVNSRLKISGNENAIGGKLGLLFFTDGAGASPLPTAASIRFLSAVASWGYVVIYGLQSPVMGAPLVRLGNSLRSLSTLLTDPSNANFIPYLKTNGFTQTGQTATLSTTGIFDASFVDASDAHLTENVFFANNFNGTAVTGSSMGSNGFVQNNNVRTSFSFGNALNFIKNPVVANIEERYMYQMICILKKLGLYSSIDFNNVLCSGTSGGGWQLATSHRLLTENSSANAGRTTQYVRIDSNGSPMYGGEKPFLFKPKALMGLQSLFMDYSSTKDVVDPSSRRFLQVNNKNAMSIDSLVVPMVMFTTDSDTWPSTTTFPFHYMNSFYQTIFQNTARITNSADGSYTTTKAVDATNALQKSMVIYRPGGVHTGESSSPYVSIPGTTQAGELSNMYPNSFVSDYHRGWEYPQNIQFPQHSVIYENGFKSEASYSQQEDYKMLVAYQLLAHRFLGNKFPVPVSALDDLGLKYDLAPTYCDNATQSQGIKFGPVAEITYDTSYNAVVNAPALKITSTVKTTDGNNITRYSDINSATIKVDASKKLVTDATGMTFAGFNFSVDASGNLIIG